MLALARSLGRAAKKAYTGVRNLQVKSGNVQIILWLNIGLQGVMQMGVGVFQVSKIKASMYLCESASWSACKVLFRFWRANCRAPHTQGTLQRSM